MLSELFTSKTRVRLLLKLFLNPKISCYLRELAQEFSLSPTALKDELDSLSSAGYLTRSCKGRSVYFSANESHPFFPELHSIVRKSLGIDRLLEDVLNSLGQVDSVYILDDYAQGKDTGIVDVLIVGSVRKDPLDNLVSIAEKKLKRKIRLLAVSSAEFDQDKDRYLKRPHWKAL